MWATISYVKKNVPMVGLVENVAGFGVAPSNEKSRLSTLASELGQAGYC